MSQFGQKVVAVIDTQSAFGVTVKTLKQNVDTLTGQMSTLLADAPETLDTLNEIAAAISDDPAFFTTMATANTTLQNNIDALATAAATARTALQTALQANIDAEALTGSNARGVLSARLDALELDPVTKTYVDTAVSDLVDAAPGVLDTLNEIAAAIGDDANFITTVNSSIAAVQADVDANETAANTAIAAVQADVDQNEADSDAAEAALSGRLDTLEADPTTAAAVAAVQADVDANEAASDAAEAALSGRLDTLEADPTTATAVAAVQADVDANEAAAATARTNLQTTLQTAIDAVQSDVDSNETATNTALADKLGLGGGTLTGSLIVQRQFPDFELKSNEEKRLLFTDAGGGATGAIKNVDSELDFFAGGVTASDKVMSVASDGVDVSALKIDGTAVTSTATELNQLDGVTLGTAATAATGDFATAAQGAKADSALQSHQDISGKANLSGAAFTGNISIAKSFPDIEIKANDEKRLLFSDAGGAATAAIKHVSSSLDFYAGGIASGDKNFSVTSSGVEASALTFTTVLSEYANDTAAAAGGVPVGGLYRTMQIVKIRIS
jgi:hypothetical protein